MAHPNLLNNLKLLQRFPESCNCVYPRGFLKSTVNAVIYQEVLDLFKLTLADKQCDDGDFIFQQVKRKVRDARPSNSDAPKAAIKATWASIPPMTQADCPNATEY